MFADLIALTLYLAQEDMVPMMRRMVTNGKNEEILQ